MEDDDRTSVSRILVNIILTTFYSALTKPHSLRIKVYHIQSMK